MRCTTCGEYIYKVSMPTSFKYLFYIKLYQGRKFNARKEDVDDMDYLGLRIYRWKSPAQNFLSLKTCLKKNLDRFYIKCTACVSEICFRTDPESCDYVLEAGATRSGSSQFCYWVWVIKGGFQEF